MALQEEQESDTKRVNRERYGKLVESLSFCNNGRLAIQASEIFGNTRKEVRFVSFDIASSVTFVESIDSEVRFVKRPSVLSDVVDFERTDNFVRFVQILQ